MRSLSHRLVQGGACAGVLFLLLAWACAQPESAPPDEQAPPPRPEIVGAQVCVACHAGVPDLQKTDFHARLITSRPGASNCEECHGPGSLHAEDPANVRTPLNVARAPASLSARACLSCHGAKIPVARWRSSPHSRANTRCWDCHSYKSSPHKLMLRRPSAQVCYSCHQEQEAVFTLTSHHPVREGRVQCYDCHDPHRPQSNRDYTDKCLSCHPQRRGPFVFAHGAISGELTEGCLDCHRPHGSPNRGLLKFAGRGLCLQCHADRVLHFAPRTCWTSGCHSAIHGSNTSPLLFGG